MALFYIRMWSQEGKVSYRGTWWTSAFYGLHHSWFQRRKKTCRLEKVYYVEMDKYGTASFTTMMKTFGKVDHCFWYNPWDSREYSEATLVDDERTKVLFLRFVECFYFLVKCLQRTSTSTSVSSFLCLYFLSIIYVSLIFFLFSWITLFWDQETEWLAKKEHLYLVSGSFGVANSWPPNHLSLRRLGHQ